MFGGGTSGRVRDCVSLGPGNKSAASDAPEGSGLPSRARTKSAFKQTASRTKLNLKQPLLKLRSS